MPGIFRNDGYGDNENDDCSALIEACEVVRASVDSLGFPEVPNQQHPRQAMVSDGERPHACYKTSDHLRNLQFPTPQTVSEALEFISESMYCPRCSRRLLQLYEGLKQFFES